eukprot:2740568-Alexandrium_andersonii.AAC.1
MHAHVSLFCGVRRPRMLPGQSNEKHNTNFIVSSFGILVYAGTVSGLSGNWDFEQHRNHRHRSPLFEPEINATTAEAVRAVYGPEHGASNIISGCKRRKMIKPQNLKNKT